MKTFASLLMRAKKLKKFGSRSAVERQIAKIIDHPDFETVCVLLDSLQKLNHMSKAADEIYDEEEILPDEALTEEDVDDLALDVSLEDEADADVAGDILLVDDLLEDSDPYSQDETKKELLNEEAKEEDFDIIIDLEDESAESKEASDEVAKDKSEEKVEEKLSEEKVEAKKASTAKTSVKKITFTKAQIAARKRALKA